MNYYINWTCSVENASLSVPDSTYDSTLNQMADRAFVHSILWNSSDGTYEHQQKLINSRSSSLEFDGVGMDDGARKLLLGSNLT